jgi:gamma-glutamyl hercynylcysteine S-oxide synthase
MTRGEQLIAWVLDARRRTLELVADLGDGDFAVPRLPIVNPLLWEIGHIAWFQEKWLLREAGRLASMRADADALYDSAAVPHDVRWGLPLPDRAETIRYLEATTARVTEKLQRGEPSPRDVYFVHLSVFHEDMHAEALTYMRQTLGYRAPRVSCVVEADGAACEPAAGSGPWPGDVLISGGDFVLGADPDAAFVFDNEKEAHRVRVAAFAIARAPVTQQEFAAFVDEGGYRDARWWSEQGWRWRETESARHPVYWQRQAAGGWLRRDFERWLPLEPHRPVVHVNWHEAEAYCRWAGRRLPTEAEWEFAAAAVPPAVPPAAGVSGVLSKRPFPWGTSAPDRGHANLDGHELGCIDVAARPAGDSVRGCRQMIGNVWEWTASDFSPYPGFVAGPYKEYSAPWFGTHKVLRGGCWATRGRLIRPSYRNYFAPERRDVFAGFRTCACSVECLHQPDA